MDVWNVHALAPGDGKPFFFFFSVMCGGCLTENKLPNLLAFVFVFYTGFHRSHKLQEIWVK